jgi:hypothetical protein
MDIDRLEKILKNAELVLSANSERFMEIDSMLSAHRFVIEQICANAFIDDPDGLTEFMNGLVEKSRTKPTTSAPMTDDERMERIARIATHLARFGDSVKLRVRQDSSS